MGKDWIQGLINNLSPEFTEIVKEAIEEAVSLPLGVTSKSRSVNVVVDGRSFTSQNKAAKYAATAYDLTFDQARDRIRRGVPLDKLFSGGGNVDTFNSGV